MICPIVASEKTKQTRKFQCAGVFAGIWMCLLLLYAALGLSLLFQSAFCFLEAILALFLKSRVISFNGFFLFFPIAAP